MSTQAGRNPQSRNPSSVPDKDKTEARGGGSLPERAVFCPAREVLEEGPRSRHTLQALLGLPPARKQRRAATLPGDLGPGTRRARSLDMEAAPSPERCSGPCLPRGPAQSARPLSALTRGRGARGRLGLGCSPCGLRAVSPRARGQLPPLAEKALPREPLPTRARRGARVSDALGAQRLSVPRGLAGPEGHSEGPRRRAGREKRPRVAHARLGPIAPPPPRRVTRGRAAVSTRWTRVSGAEGEGGRRLGRCPAPPSPARSLGPLTGRRMAPVTARSSGWAGPPTPRRGPRKWLSSARPPSGAASGAGMGSRSLPAGQWPAPRGPVTGCREDPDARPLLTAQPLRPEREFRRAPFFPRPTNHFEGFWSARPSGLMPPNQRKGRRAGTPAAGVQEPGPRAPAGSAAVFPRLLLVCRRADRSVVEGGSAGTRV